MQDAEKQFAKTRSEADKLKLETAQADYDNMVRNLKPVTKGAGDTEKAISKIEDTATGSSNAFSGIVGAIAQIRICKSFFSKVLKLLAFQGVWMFLYSRFPLFFPLSGKNKGKSYCTLSSSFAASRLASLLACA